MGRIRSDFLSLFFCDWPHIPFGFFTCLFKLQFQKIETIVFNSISNMSTEFNLNICLNTKGDQFIMQ